MPHGPEWLVLGFVGLWLAMSAFLSLLSGWHALARSFRSEGPAEGERFERCPGALGFGQLPVSYGRMLSVTVSAEGFSLSVLFLFRFMHPPLFIPWSAIERCENVRRWFSERVAVQLPGFSPQLLFGGEAGRRILEEWKRASGRS